LCERCCNFSYLLVTFAWAENNFWKARALCPVVIDRRVSELVVPPLRPLFERVGNRYRGFIRHDVAFERG
jgi:hypothetical protein